MGQTTEELNAEIAGTRESLASDLDALQDRVSPSAIVERRKAAAKGRIHQVRARVMGSVDSARSSTGDASGQAAGAVRDGPAAWWMPRRTRWRAARSPRGWWPSGPACSSPR